MMGKNGSYRVGVYVDVSNIALSGGYGLHYDVLRQFACRNENIAMRLNAYVAYDEDEGKRNQDYRRKAMNFHAVLRDFGYKVIVKIVRWFKDDTGRLYAKANADLDMAVDALMQSERLDYVLLVTGDGDFLQVVRALQSKGIRVEVVAFQNVSQALRKEADVFISGYLIPNLLSPDYGDDTSEKPKWGEEGSIVRGMCYAFHHDKGYGFLRFVKDISGGLWIVDSRRQESPYCSVFAHLSQFPTDFDVHQLPNREQIFEFRIVNSDKGIQAYDIRPVYHY